MNHTAIKLLFHQDQWNLIGEKTISLMLAMKFSSSFDLLYLCKTNVFGGIQESACLFSGPRVCQYIRPYEADIVTLGLG